MEQEKLTITISKNPSYDKQKCRTEGLDIDRVIKFNNFEKIEVTKEELEAIGLHRWLIIGEKDGSKDIIENGTIRDITTEQSIESLDSTSSS